MRLTIVPDDRCIIKDGEPLVFDFAAPAGWHAVQWYGDYGTIEHKIGGAEYIDDEAIVQPFADAYAEERARLDAAEVAAAAAAAAAK